MKVVIDSNVLVAMIGRRSVIRPLWDAFVEGKYQLAVSEDILKEYEEILQRHSANGADQLVMEIFIESPDVHFHSVYYKWNIINEDPDDNKFFDIAIASNADYIITNDSHFNKIKNVDFPKVKVINAAEFLEVLKEM